MNNNQYQNNPSSIYLLRSGLMENSAYEIQETDRNLTFNSFIISHFYLFVLLFIKTCWFSLGLFFFLLNIKKWNIENYFLLAIIVISLLNIFRYLNKFLIKSNEALDIPISKCRQRITTFCGIINSMFFYCFLILWFNYTSHIRDPVYSFLFVYVIVEYIGYFLVIMLMFFILKCGNRIHFPHLIIHVMNDLPISENKNLNKLVQCTYYNNLFINSELDPIQQDYFKDFFCVICHDAYVNNDNVVLLECQHHYHKQCCLEWFKINNTCPICRAEI